jgi:hypothetical protein
MTAAASPVTQSEIREQFQLHRQTCDICSESQLCSVGLKLGAMAREAPRGEISADAAYIVNCAREDSKMASGRIVKHLWIIFVLLPVVLIVLFELLK